MGRIQSVSSFLQSLPLIKGKRRIGRALLNATGISKMKNLEVNTKAGIFTLPNLLDMISIDLFINGYYEKGLVKHLAANIPQNGFFLDVGANIGSISIPLSKSRPDVTVFAIEASPWIFNILKSNIALNKISNITALNFAVYSVSGRSLPMYAPKDLFGKGSLKSVYTNEAEMIDTITIDDIARQYNLKSIDYMKVDVEGFEASVFNGMTTVSASFKPKIIFEFSEWAELAAGFNAREAQSIILSQGYKLQQLDEEFRPLGDPATHLLDIKNANLFAS